MESARRLEQALLKTAVEKVPLIGLADDLQAVELALPEGGQHLLRFVFDEGQVHGQSTRWLSAI
jgi:hypothetical protein